jgi:hypothetical protein
MSSFKIEEVVTGKVKVAAGGIPVSLSIVVRNVSASKITGAVKIEPLDASQDSWFKIEGEKQRVFSPNATDNFRIIISVPKETKDGTYRFRLNAWSESDPNNDYSEGNPVEFEVSTPPPPPSTIPWWIFIAIGAVVIIGTIITVSILTCNNDKTTVPSLKDKSWVEVKSLIANAKLKIKIRTAGNVNDTLSWTATNQLPEGGSVAKAGDTVSVDFKSPVITPPSNPFTGAYIGSTYFVATPTTNGYQIKIDIRQNGGSATVSVYSQVGGGLPTDPQMSGPGTVSGNSIVFNFTQQLGGQPFTSNSMLFTLPNPNLLHFTHHKHFLQPGDTRPDQDMVGDLPRQITAVGGIRRQFGAMEMRAVNGLRATTAEAINK